MSNWNQLTSLCSTWCNPWVIGVLAGAWGKAWRAGCTEAGPWLAGCSGWALGRLAGCWRAGCAWLVPGGLAALSWSLEGWLHCWLVPGGLAALSWSLEGWLHCWLFLEGWLHCCLVPVTPNMLKMCSFNSLRHGISVEKQLGYSFKVQVLAVIHLNTQLKSM